MANGVTIQEFNSSSLLHGNDVWNERHFPLVDHNVVFRRIELLICYHVNVDGNAVCGLDSLHADLALDFIGPAYASQHEDQTCCDCCLCYDFRQTHDIPLVFDVRAIQFPSPISLEDVVDARLERVGAEEERVSGYRIRVRMSKGVLIFAYDLNVGAY